MPIEASNQPRKPIASPARRLTNKEIGAALQLRALGKPQTEIARTLGCNQSSISELLSSVVDTLELAKLRSRARANEITEATLNGVISSAKAGDPKPGLDVLDSLGIIERRRTESNATAIMINIGLPDHPIGQAPIIVETSTIDCLPSKTGINDLDFNDSDY